MMRFFIRLITFAAPILVSLAGVSYAACPTAGPLLGQNLFSEIACRGPTAQAQALANLGALPPVAIPSSAYVGGANGILIPATTPLVPANNLSDVASLSAALANLGGLSTTGNGSGLTGLLWAQIGSTPTTVAGYGISDALVATNNLSDVVSAATARTNLGLGTVATQSAGAVSITGATLLTGLPTPTNATDAATKAYVDSSVAGFTPHIAVVVTSTSPLPDSPAYNNGTAGVGATLTATTPAILTIDGVAPSLNARVLVQEEAVPANNGCYALTTVGTGSVDYVLTRCVDFNTAEAGNIANNAYFFVQSGTANAASGWVLSQSAPITVGTTALPFTQFSASASYGAASPVTLTGNAFGILPGGISNTQLASGAAAANLGYTPANVANNLSDLTSVSVARTNIGLGTAAVANTGTSGATVPLLNAANTVGALWSFGSGLTVSSGNLGITTGNFTVTAGNLTVSAGTATIAGGILALGGGSITASATNDQLINVHTQYGIGGSFYSNGTTATTDYLQFYAAPTGGAGLGIYSKGSIDTEIPIEIVPASISGTSLLTVVNGIQTNASTVTGNNTNIWNQNLVRVASDRYFADSDGGFTLLQATDTFGGNQLTGIASSGASNGIITFSSLPSVPLAPPAYGTVSITTGGTMTASGTVGTWAVGQHIIPTGARFAVNGMTITAFVSGAGGDGTYTVSPAPPTAISGSQVIGQIPGGLIYVAADTTTPANLPTNSFLLASGAGTATVSTNASAIGTDTVVFYPTVGARTGFDCLSVQAGTTGDFATSYGQPFYSCASIGMSATANLGGTSPTNQYGILSTFNDNLVANNATFLSATVHSEWDSNVNASSSMGINGWLKFVFGTDGLAQAHGFQNQDFGLLFGSAGSGSYVDHALWLGGISDWDFSASSIWFDANLTVDASGVKTTASFATNVMTVTSAAQENIQPGNMIVFGGVAPGTTVVAQLTVGTVPGCPAATICPGQNGTYSLSTTPGTIASESGYVYTATSGMPLYGGLNINAATLQLPTAGGFAVQSNGMWIDSLGAYHAGLASLAPTTTGASLDVTDSIATSFSIANAGAGYQIGNVLRWHDGIFVVDTVNVSTGAIVTYHVWQDPSGNHRYPTYAGLTGQPATITPTLVGTINVAMGATGFVLAPVWTTPDTTVGIGNVNATAINIGNSGSTTNIAGSVVLPSLASGTATKYVCLTSGNVLIAQASPC